MTTVDTLRAAMVEHLAGSGTLRTAPWTRAFAAAPRHLFLPRFFRQTPGHSGWQPVGEGDTDWLVLIYSDTTLVTQLDNDPTRWDTARTTGQPATGVPTSSSTAPGLMALMLEALDIDDDHTLLEVGTGTGYNAAVLTHRLGADQVTSIEFDPVVADNARAALLASGYTPRVIVGDGAAGDPEQAPYDRIIATCSMAAIPPAWATQLKPGGVLLTNLHRDLGGGALALLRRDAQGTLTGHFLPDYGGFMPTRRTPPADANHLLTAAFAAHDAAAERPAQIDPELLNHPDFGMLAALRLPGVTSLTFEPQSGPQLWVLATDGSAACVDQTTTTVTQHGTRRLWDEIETLHQDWTAAGTPARHQFGLTVTDTGEHQFWLDHDEHLWWTDRPSPRGIAT